jgi:hypothetical protein
MVVVAAGLLAATRLAAAYTLDLRSTGEAFHHNLELEHPRLTGFPGFTLNCCSFGEKYR